MTVTSATAPQVTVGAAVTRSRWRELHEADPAPTQAPEWTDCLVATGGYQDASRPYEMPDGRAACRHQEVPMPGSDENRSITGWKTILHALSTPTRSRLAVGASGCSTVVGFDRLGRAGHTEQGSRTHPADCQSFSHVCRRPR